MWTMMMWAVSLPFAILGLLLYWLSVVLRIIAYLLMCRFATARSEMRLLTSLELNTEDI